MNKDYGQNMAAETHGDSNSVKTFKSCDSDVHQSTKLFQKRTLSRVFINNIRESSSVGKTTW